MIVTRGHVIVPTMLAGLLSAQGPAPTQRPVESVAAVDLERYAGRWYEIAKLPNRFQAGCAGGTVADYAVLPDGRISVTNRCRTADGDTTEVQGVARLARAEGPTSRLKVRFAPAVLSFLPFVWGDYWVLGLTADYGAALVGAPNRKYLWVLSRTEQLDGSVYDKLVSIAEAQGFDVQRLERTPQP